MRDSLDCCPACDKPMQIRSYGCPACGTEVHGRFSGCSFCRMSDEDRYLCLVLVQCEGNLKDVQRVMGISYPTVKSRLVRVRKALQGSSPAEPPMEPAGKDASDVLAALERGEIEFDEAMAKLGASAPKGE